MSIKVFKMVEGSEQHQFFACREEVALYTGGYNNGKTAVLCIQAIRLASEYAEGRFLVGRATRPKLEDSTKPELIKWLPKEGVVQWPSDRKNNILLENGSTIEFRHIRQEGKGRGEEQSNLLSATYDGVFVDQFDDPEFSYKDFEDLTGRLRGTARYTGNDPTMPRQGPQWFRGTANPTRNWLFRELVNPFFMFRKTGFVTPKLLYDKEEKKPFIQVFNAPSAAHDREGNKGYLRRANIIFRGSHKKRFVQGDWDAYEGLVYPDYDSSIHQVDPAQLNEWIRRKILDGEVGLIEAYDYGKIVPSCYLIAFVDDVGNVFIVDGFYEPNKTIKEQAAMIKKLRMKWSLTPTERIFADPDIFKAKNARKDNVGEAISNMFGEYGIEMQKGANAVDAGIQKVSSYLQVDKFHKHPIYKTTGAPRLFISGELSWFDNEIVDYYWNKNIAGDNVDKPRDSNDHAMDATKYLFTKRPAVIGMIRRKPTGLIPAALLAWHEIENSEQAKQLPRHMM